MAGEPHQGDSRPGLLPSASSRSTDAQTEATAPAPSHEQVLDAFVYSGQRHEVVPLALLLDRRLTPLERNAWQAIRLQLMQREVMRLSTYVALRPLLAAVPCGPMASFETVARALKVLRLTRWLSLVRQRRDVRTGRLLGHLYVLHDAPLTPYEAMQLDEEYLALVSAALVHASKVVQRVAQHVLAEVRQDPRLRDRALSTRMDALQALIDTNTIDASTSATCGAEIAPYSESEAGVLPYSDTEAGPSSESEAGVLPYSESEAGPYSDSEVGHAPYSESEISSQQTVLDLLRNPNKDSTVRTVLISKVRTVPRVRADARARLTYPPAWERLQEAQRAGALSTLATLDADLQQAVLDEWGARCASDQVRTPAGYLFGMIQKAIRGEFKRWAACVPAPLAASREEAQAAPAPRKAPPRVDRATYNARMTQLLEVLNGRDED